MRQCRTCGESKPLMDFYRQSNGGIDRDCRLERIVRLQAIEWSEL